jgi:flavin-dependent dehydrogenase
VGADGVNGVVARSVGLHAGREHGAALEAEVQVSPAAQAALCGQIWFHFSGVPYGYAWAFPKAQHLSVGVATFRPGLRLDLRALLRQFLDGTPALREHTVLHQQGHRLPLGGQALPLHGGRVILAGDAGGFADPFLGEGIYYAIRSGQLAGQTVSQALANGAVTEHLAGYTRQANARYHAEFRHVRRFAAVLYRAPALCQRLYGRSHTLQRLVAQFLRPDFSFRLTPAKAARVGVRLARDLLRPTA